MKMKRHSLWGNLMLGSAVLLASAYAVYYWLHQSKTDYSRLVEFIQMKDKDAPLYILDDFVKEFEKEPHQASLEYLNEDPRLLKRIRSDLGGGRVRWRLEELEHRQLFVPETRREYAILFEKYCHEAIQYILDKTNLANPYGEIRTLLRERPQLQGTNGHVTAFIVHNLVKEYVATYVFTNQRRKKIRIRLSGRIFSGIVGSYSTNIHLREDGSFELVSDPYTIWQNSAENPYTALVAPAEETLHIALRKHTERAIREKLERNSVKDIMEAERIANDWMAVEEALVGGLVYALLPAVLEKHVDNLSDSWIQEDIDTKSNLRKYRYLRKGIEIIRRIGWLQAVKMYESDPRLLRNLLTRRS